MQRLESLRAEMARRSVERLWVEPSVGFRYLTGLDPIAMERLTGLLVPVEGEIVVVAPLMFEEELGPLGFELATWTDSEGPDAALAHALTGIDRVHVQASLPAWALMKLVDAGADVKLDPGALARLRERKGPEEIAKLGAAADFTDALIEWIAGLELAGVAEKELATKMRIRYLENPDAAEPIALVASGANASMAHYSGGDVSIALDRPLLVDTGAAIDGYWSDTTRMYMPNDLEPEIDKAFDLVCAAYDAAFERVQPGVPAQEIDRAARQVIDEAGYGEFFHHRTGHGVGLEIHEEPYIREGNERPLEVGHVFSIEPGIYLPGRFGLRYENLVYVDEQGAKALNRSARRHSFSSN